MSAAASEGSKAFEGGHPKVDGSKADEYESPKVDHSTEFDHPKIGAGHADPNWNNLNSKVNQHGHPVEQEQAVDVLPRPRRQQQQMMVVVGHDVYLMVGIAVFLAMGLGTKYCVRGKEKPSRIRAYDA